MCRTKFPSFRKKASDTFLKILLDKVNSAIMTADLSVLCRLMALLVAIVLYKIVN